MEPVTAVRGVRRLAGALLAALLTSCGAGPHRDDAAAVGAVLGALANGDLAPVRDSFAPGARGQLDDRVHVGILSRELAPLGALSGVQALPDASGGAVERFAATFAGGKRLVDVNFDENGKIAAFWVHGPHAAP